MPDCTGSRGYCVEKKAGLVLWTWKAVMVTKSISFHGKSSLNLCCQIFGIYLEQFWYGFSELYIYTFLCLPVFLISFECADTCLYHLQCAE